MTTSRAAAAALLAASLLAAAPRSQAQGPAPTLTPGQKVAGRLALESPAFANGTRFAAYRFRAEQGRLYRLTLTSADFDARLRLAAPTGPLVEFLRDNDNGAGGTDARIRFLARQPGWYWAVASPAILSTTSADSTRRLGAFELAVEEVTLQPLRIESIAVGQEVRGELGDSTAVLPGSSARHALYTFQARRGQALRVGLLSPTSLVRFSVGRRVEGVFNDSMFTDTVVRTAADRLARILTPGGRRDRVITIPDDGEYAIQVRGANEETSGTYVLALWDTLAPRPRRVLTAGQDTAATLASHFSLNESGAPYHDWVYIARAGERLEVRMRSREFNTYLSVGRMEASGFRSIAFNDNADSTNSRVSTTARESGEYVIRAMGNTPTRFGTYTLRLDTRPAVFKTTRVDTLHSGHEAAGRLDDSDPELELDGSVYDDWSYRAVRPGERIEVTLRSTDFDTYLSVGRRVNGRFEEFTSNDDAPDDHRASRLEAVLPAAGEYLVRVNSFGPTERGAYTVVVRPAGPRSP